MTGRAGTVPVAPGGPAADSASTSSGRCPCSRCPGSVDLATLPQLGDALFRLVADHPGQRVAVDLDGVDVLDDTGLGVLLGAAGRARQAGGDLVVVVRGRAAAGSASPSPGSTAPSTSSTASPRPTS